MSRVRTARSLWKSLWYPWTRRMTYADKLSLRVAIWLVLIYAH